MAAISLTLSGAHSFGHYDDYVPDAWVCVGAAINYERYGLAPIQTGLGIIQRLMVAGF